MSPLRSALRYLAYPVLMLAGLVVLGALLANGASIAWAPYVAIAVVGPLVLLTERIIPYRPAWLPSGSDIVEDGVFMGVVQVVVPLALGYAAALALGGILSEAGAVWRIWPGDWPVWAQLALKIIAGDFLRYWLHRLAHTWPPLWRLHEVHHHPEKLYTTNVFRFHPAEKGLQYFCDTLPFLVIGIGPDVLGFYFVFYAVSGLFQHSNCDIRLGWLNYIVSGPEVHRWHHSKLITESNNNYAHSFVVWDLVFGTYFRPRDRQVDSLGLLDPNYPKGFWRQLGAPFRRKRRADEPV